jgi:hypothetical protein
MGHTWHPSRQFARQKHRNSLQPPPYAPLVKPHPNQRETVILTFDWAHLFVGLATIQGGGLSQDLSRLSITTRGNQKF